MITYEWCIVMAYDGWWGSSGAEIHLQEVPAEETVEDPEEDETMQKLWKANMQTFSKIVAVFQESLSESQFFSRNSQCAAEKGGSRTRVSSGEVWGMIPVRFNDRILQHVFCFSYHVACCKTWEIDEKILGFYTTQRLGRESCHQKRSGTTRTRKRSLLWESFSNLQFGYSGCLLVLPNHCLTA